jgi:phage gp46-like protein
MESVREGGVVTLMPADVRTAWSPATAPLRGDWLLEPPGLATDHNLETAVVLSLWTDASAREDDVIPDGTDDRRGWWGNWESPEEVPLGSRLWLLEREKSTDETRRRAEEYAAEALQWMLDDAVAARIDVEANYLEVGPVPPQTLLLRVQITRDDATIYDRRFAWAWTELMAEGVATDAVWPDVIIPAGAA